MKKSSQAKKLTGKKRIEEMKKSIQTKTLEIQQTKREEELLEKMKKSSQLNTLHLKIQQTKRKVEKIEQITRSNKLLLLPENLANKKGRAENGKN